MREIVLKKYTCHNTNSIMNTHEYAMYSEAEEIIENLKKRKEWYKKHFEAEVACTNNALKKCKESVAENARLREDNKRMYAALKYAMDEFRADIEKEGACPWGCPTENCEYCRYYKWESIISGAIKKHEAEQ
jgi:hypothetical protein